MNRLLPLITAFCVAALINTTTANANSVANTTPTVTRAAAILSLTPQFTTWTVRQEGPNLPAAYLAYVDLTLGSLTSVVIHPAGDPGNGTNRSQAESAWYHGTAVATLTTAGKHLIRIPQEQFASSRFVGLRIAPVGPGPGGSSMTVAVKPQYD